MLVRIATALSLPQPKETLQPGTVMRITVESGGLRWPSGPMKNKARQARRGLHGEVEPSRSFQGDVRALSRSFPAEEFKRPSRPHSKGMQRTHAIGFQAPLDSTSRARTCHPERSSSGLLCRIST